ASGSPASEFAAAHGLKKSHLYDWSFRMRAVPEIEGDASPSTFTELRVREAIAAGAETSAAIEIEVHGHLIRVRAGADLRLLEAVLAVVSRC
ncbi:MAG: hypothetical protein IAG13_20725, partial [Deltaproteobacteria bacterium]|nr:hypothetical protein [Nannocystaceae bacterium]